MIAASLAKLRAMSNDELIKNHDETAKHNDVGVSYYLEELARRDQERQTKAMLRYTRWIIAMTVVMTIATVINVFSH